MENIKSFEEFHGIDEAKSEDVSNHLRGDTKQEPWIPSINIYIKDYNGIDGMNIDIGSVLWGDKNTEEALLKFKADKKAQEKFMKSLQDKISKILQEELKKI